MRGDPIIVTRYPDGSVAFTQPAVSFKGIQIGEPTPRRLSAAEFDEFKRVTAYRFDPAEQLPLPTEPT